MRYFCCFIVTLSAYLLNAEEPYLYRTEIKVSNTIVLSGPGEHFYPVSQLQYGDTIEVYYERDGYLAVRPPVGSYSWVSAKYVQIDTNNTGTVITDGLASIIGSSLTEDCSTVQVRLKRGEKVFVLDRRETPENADSPLWLKIAPPSGEFRWIAKSSITGKSGTADKTQESSGVRQVRYDQIDDAFPAVNKGNTNTQTPLPLSKPAAETNKEPAPASLGEAKVASNRRLPLDGVSDASAAPFSKALKELEREAQTVMTRPADDAVFEVLIKRGEELYQTAPTDKDLEKTFHIVESLKRTRQVRREFALNRPAGSRNSTANRSPVPAVIVPAVNTAQPAVQRTTTVPQFDITGKLGEFDPLPKGHPPYAVVDAQGLIICLISPSEGVDLNPYIGKQVGINGIIGFYERPNKPKARHIAAKNVCEWKIENGK